MKMIGIVGSIGGDTFLEVETIEVGEFDIQHQTARRLVAGT